MYIESNSHETRKIGAGGNCKKVLDSSVERQTRGKHDQQTFVTICGSKGDVGCRVPDGSTAEETKWCR